MADYYAIRGVWNETTGSAYQRDTDYEDDGGGSPVVIPGSQLETDIANGDTIKYTLGTGSADAPGLADQYYQIDADYSGARRVSLGDDWDLGTDVNIDLDGIHVNEHLRSHQSNCSFVGPADEATCRNLQETDFIALRLGLKTLDGVKTWRKEWRFKVTERTKVNDQNGIRHFEYFAADPSEDMRLADVSEVPRNPGSEAETITYPRTDGEPDQQSLIGAQLYTFKQLLDAVLPFGATLVLNAPDFIIERLPEQGDGLELVAAALEASAYDLRWDGSTLVVEQYARTPELVSLVVTDDHILEARKKLGDRRKALDSVVIERPSTFPTPDQATSTPSTDLPPVNSSGGSTLPSQTLVESARSGDITVYEINKLWHPTQLYVDYEPAPLKFAFGDPVYLRQTEWTGSMLHDMMVSSPGQVSVTPPTYFTPTPENGYYGLDYYWKIAIPYIKIREANADYVDVWVVSRAGYNDDTGAVATRSLIPVANARVLLRDPATGITLGPQTTNGDGYARFATGGNRAVWVASVYHLTDAYLANKLDDFTEGHPYDDVPGNDNLGPDNSIIISEQYQLPEEFGVYLTVKWRTGRDPRSGPVSSVSDLYESYRSQGQFSYGSDGPEVLTVDELSSLDIATENINTEIGAALWGEKKVEESREQLTTIEVTRMFSGTDCEVGRVVHIETAIDEVISENARIVTRQIQVRGPELLETWSTEVDKFVNKLEDRFAMKPPVEDKLRQVRKTTKKLRDAVLQLTGQLQLTGNLNG